jgi:hypothetical protein
LWLVLVALTSSKLMVINQLKLDEEAVVVMIMMVVVDRREITLTTTFIASTGGSASSKCVFFHSHFILKYLCIEDRRKYVYGYDFSL